MTVPLTLGYKVAIGVVSMSASHDDSETTYYPPKPASLPAPKPSPGINSPRPPHQAAATSSTTPRSGVIPWLPPRPPLHVLCHVNECSGRVSWFGYSQSSSPINPSASQGTQYKFKIQTMMMSAKLRFACTANRPTSCPPHHDPFLHASPFQSKRR